MCLTGNNSAIQQNMIKWHFESQKLNINNSATN